MKNIRRIESKAQYFNRSNLEQFELLTRKKVNNNFLIFKYFYVK